MSTSSNCILCDKPLAASYWNARDAYSGSVFSILTCEDCGLGHTAPMPDDIGRYYSHGYHGGRHGFTADYCVARRMRFVDRSAVRPPGKLLDVGCGEGTFLLKARSAGWEVAGIEIEPKAARAAGLEVRGTIEEVAELAPFDCITFWHSLEHLPDPVHAVRIANRLLTPEGVLCIAVPDFGGLQAPLFGPDWLHLDVPRHLHHFTPSSLTRLLEQCGFKPRKTWHQEFEYDLLGWIQSAINKLLPTQNLFFDMLRGKTPKAPIWEKITAVTIGPLLGIPALPATWLGTLAGRGGTLIIAASKASSSS